MSDYQPKKSPSQWISIQEAAHRAPYSQEYLSLLARRSKIFAKKIGRNWYTTHEALERYISDQALLSPISKLNSTIELASAPTVSNDLVEEFKRLNPQVFAPQEAKPAPSVAPTPAPAPVITPPTFTPNVQDDAVLKKLDRLSDSLETFASSVTEAIPAITRTSQSAPIDPEVKEFIQERKNSSSYRFNQFNNFSKSMLQSPTRLMTIVVTAVTLLFILVGGFSFGQVDAVAQQIKKAFTDATTIQGHFAGTHANEVLVLDKAGNISIYGHIETEGQLRSHAPEGVAPIVVDSMTKVENLNADYFDNLDAKDFTLAFVTKNGNLTYEDVFLEGNVEVGKTLTVKGATKLLDSLQVYGTLGVISDAVFGKDVTLTNGNLVIGKGTIKISNMTLVKNLNAEYLDGLTKGGINLQFVTSNGASTMNAITVGGITSNGVGFFNSGLWGSTGSFGSLGVSGGASIGRKDNPENSRFEVYSKYFSVNNIGNVGISGTLAAGNTSTGDLLVRGAMLSSLVPSGSFNLGSSGQPWSELYAVNGTFSGDVSFSGSLNFAGTASNSFVINTDNTTADTENSYIRFNRGSVTPGAMLAWDSTLKQFSFNEPVVIASSSVTAFEVSGGAASISNTLFVQSSGNVGIGTTSPETALEVIGTASASAGVFGHVAIPGLFTAIEDPTGFVNRTNAISWDDGTLTFTIAGDHDVYIDGVRKTMSGTTKQIADTTGVHYIYYDSNWAIQESTTHPGFFLPTIATVYWNTTINKGLLGDERHGIKMDGATHELLHETVGVRYESGLTGSFTDTTFDVTAGVIDDEDIEHSIGVQTTTLVLYKNGAADFEWDGPQAAYYKTVTGTIQYNNGNALTNVPNNNYVAYWIFATNDADYPIISLMGQNVSNNLTDARNDNTYQGLSLGSLPFPEMKILYRVIVRNLGGTPDYIEAQDLRNISNLPSGTYVATQHNALTGLEWSLSGHNDSVFNVNNDGLGRVGIGTTSPLTKLEIQGTASASNLFTVGSLQIGSGATIATVSYNRLGTNITAHSLSTNSDLLISGKLEVSGNAYFDGTVNFSTSSSSYFYAQPGTAGSPSFSFTIDKNTGLFRKAADSISVSAGGLERLNLTNTTASISNALYIDSSRNVGIGTTAPGRLLSLYGTNPRISIDSLAASEPGLEIYNTGTLKWLLYRPTNTNDFRIYDAVLGTDVMSFLTNTGKVGIGTTEPKSNLDITGAGEARLDLYDSSGAASRRRITLINDFFEGSENDLRIQTRDDAGTGIIKQLITIKADSGNVGIGSTLPASRLQVLSSQSSYDEEIIRFGRNDDAVAGYINFRGEAPYINSLSIGTKTDHPFMLEQNSVPVVIIDNTGNVGIGTTIPGAKLDVVSDVIFREGLQVAGTATTSYSRFGVNTTGHGLSVASDLLISGKLEVDGMTYFDGTVNFDISSSSYFYAQSGTAASPAYSFAIDKNTGLFRKAADSISVSAGGLERLNLTNTTASISNALYIDSSRNVGIGTTAPGYPLDLQAAQSEIQVKSTTGTNRADTLYVNTNGTAVAGVEGSAGGALIGGSSAYAAVYGNTRAYPTQFGTSNAINMTILSGGNVGIGTTVPTTKLDISGSASVSTNFEVLSGYASISNTLFVDTGTGGYVGIGTTAPTEQLTITKNLWFNTAYSTTTSEIKFGTDKNQPSIQNDINTALTIWNSGSGHDFKMAEFLGSNTATIRGAGADGATRVSVALDSRYTLATPGAKLLSIRNSGVEKAYVDYAGGAYFASNVGIGTTAPAYLLDVNTNARVRTQFIAKNTGSYGAVRLNSGSATQTGYIEWAGAAIDGNSGTRYAYMGYDTADLGLNLENGADFLINGGNVGIGTTAPAQTLHAKGVTEIEAGGASGTLGDSLIFAYTGLPSTYLHRIQTSFDSSVAANNRIDFLISNANSSTNVNVLSLNGAGNVGIGDSSPETKFEVVGTASISGDLYVGGFTQVNGIASSSFAGLLELTGLPSGTDIYQGSLYINPLSSGVNNVLIGVAVDDVEKARLDASGNLSIVGNFNSTTTTGTSQLSGHLSVLNNTTLGDASSDLLTVNAGLNSDLLPSEDNTINLGSPDKRFANFYAVNATFSTNTDLPGTTSASFTIFTSNITDDASSSYLAFHRGTVTPDAKLTWDAVNKNFSFNFPVSLNGALLGQGTTSSSFAGPVWFTGVPTGTAISNGSVFINPSTAAVNTTVFGIGVNNVQKFKVDAEGDVFAYSGLTVTNEATIQGVNGLTLSGANAPITFSGGGTNILSSSDILQINAFTLGGTITGNNQNIVGLDHLSAKTASLSVGLEITGGGTASISGNANFWGNVAIGGTTPLTVLDITKVGTTMGGTADSGLHIGQAGATNNLAQIGLGYAGTYVPVAIGAKTTTQTGNTIADLYFATRALNTDTAPIERMRITSAGNVSIGDETSPDAALDINPASTYTGPLLIVASGSNEIFRITSTGNVGIGTTVPGAKLEVADSGSVRTLIHSTAAGGIAGINLNANSQNWYIDNRGTADVPNNRLAIYDNAVTEVFTIQQGGNVGINATTPEQKLEVGGNIIASASANVFLTLNSLGTGLDEGKFSIIASGAAGIDQLRINNGANTNLVTIASNGNVGIGTTGPAKMLEIVDTAATNTAQIKLNSPSSTLGATYIGNYANTTWISTGGTYQGAWTPDDAARPIPYISILSANANSAISLATTPTNGSVGEVRLHIDKDGKVGIGSSAPDYRLDVLDTTALVIRGNSNSSSGTQLNLNNSDTGGGSWSLISTGSGNDPGAGDFAIYGNSGYRMVIESSGNVGIGTTSPDSLLELVSTATNFIIRSTGATSSASINFQPSGGASVSNQGKFTIEVGGTGITSESLRFENANNMVLMSIASAGGVTVSGISGQPLMSYSLTSAPTTKVWTQYLQDYDLRFYDTADRLTLQGETGNVGIGSTAPVAHLDIVGNPSYPNVAQFRVASASGDASFYITKGSNVGIGTTTPAFKLDVVGDINIPTGSQYKINGVDQALDKWSAGTGNDIYRQTGHVTIGGVSPVAGSILNLASASATFSIQSTDSNASASIVFLPNNANSENKFTIRAGGLSSAGGDRLTFLNGAGTSLITIASQNYVGFGTTSPGTRIDANGYIRTSNGILGPSSSGKLYLYGDMESSYPLTITDSGYAGILSGGTVDAAFEVGGVASISGTTYLAKRFTFYENSGRFGLFTGASMESNASMSFSAYGNNSIVLGTNGSERLTVRGNGYVGIGDTSPDALLDVHGTVCLDLDANDTCNDNTSAISDARLKTNVTNLTNGLQLTQQLRPVRFTWNGEYNTGTADSLGFLAQEVETIFPELVITDTAGYKNLDYGKLTAVLTSAIQELSTKVDSILTGSASYTITNINEVTSTLTTTDELVTASASIGILNITDQLCLGSDCRTSWPTADFSSLDLSNYAQLTDLSPFVSSSSLASTLSNYVTTSQLTDTLASLTIASSSLDLSDYAKLSDIPSPVTLANLSGTMTGDIIPDQDITYNLGSPTNKLANIYAKYVHTGDLVFAETWSAITNTPIQVGDMLSLYASSSAGGTSTAPILLSDAIARITSNVGIGTTTANSKLEVNGDIRLTSGSGGSLIFADGTTMSSAAGALAGASSIGDVNLVADTDANGSGAINFVSGASSKMTITNTGNVGIGTAVPTHAFEVSGTSYFSDVLTFGSSASISTNFEVGGYASIGGNTYIGGNVGIGTTVPTTKLDISGSASVSTNFEVLSGYASISNTLFVDTGTGGYVGIGTTAPGAKLDVRGALNAGTNGTEFTVSTAGAVAAASTITGTTINGTTGINTGAGAGTLRLDSAGALSNITSLTLSGAISGGTTITGTTINGTTGINTGAGAGTLRINSSGALSNITSITLSGAISGGTTIGGTTITASVQFTGPGTGLTGTASSLSIGGNAGTVTNGMYLNVQNNMSGTIGRTAHAAGYQVGSYNSVGSNDAKTNPIYIIGSSYAPTDTSIAGAYGIGYAHENFWGAGKSTGWGLYSFANGTVDATISTSGIWSGGTITAASTVTGSSFTGAGTGLTGTAASLNIGGTSNNITAYTINQNVGTANSPTFANAIWSSEAYYTGGAATRINSNQFYCNNASWCYYNYSGTGATYLGNAAGVIIPAASNLYLDGGSDTYIEESSGDTISVYSAGNLTHRMYNTLHALGGIDVNASVRVNIKSAAYGLYVWASDGVTANMYTADGGTGYLRAAAWTYGSDRRLKENIEYLDDGLTQIMALKPAQFDYINGEKDQLGFIAQDVQPVIPSAVVIATPENGMLGLKSDFVIPLLVLAVQNHENRIGQLENKVSSQSTAFETLQAQVASLSLTVDGLLSRGIASGSATVTVTSDNILAALLNATLTKVQSLWATGDIIAEGIKKTYFATADTLTGLTESIANLAANWTSRDITIASNASDVTKALFTGNSAQAADQSKVDLAEDGNYLATYGVDSTRGEIQLSGSSQIVNGEARVFFDYSFSSIISEKAPIRVLVTPTSIIQGQLYTENKTQFGFVVKELNAQESGTFDWLVIARRKGFDSDVASSSPSIVITPESTPTATSDTTPTPEVTPEPTLEVIPTPTPDAEISPTPESTPIATPEITPAPEATPITTETPTPTPEITPTSTPEPTPELIPSTTPEPTPDVIPVP